MNTGKKEIIGKLGMFKIVLVDSARMICLDVHQILAEKELEARQKVLEERRLREEARLAASQSSKSIS